jgi:hypothetical protein
MSSPGQRRTLDRFTQINDLALSVRWMLKRTLWLLALLLTAETVFLWFTHRPGALAFALISLGTLIVFAVWQQSGVGLPIVPMLGLQHLVAYGLPIVIGHEVLTLYPERYLVSAGFEILIFSCCLAAAWRFGMQTFPLSSPVSYALQGFNRQGSEKLRRLGFRLLLAATAYQVLHSTHRLELLLAKLPSGTGSLLVALVSIASACGFFLVSMFAGVGALTSGGRLLFWGLLIVNCFISAASYLLSPATTIVASVLIGLFWSSGRMPWRYLTVVLLTLSFLNVGKYTMRDRYWNQREDDPMPELSLAEMPASYAEWFEASYDDLVGNNERTEGGIGGEKAKKKGQSLLERVNNLQNLLYVIDAMETWNIPPLGGKTYTIIPPLLLPRILWPEKPRTHAGQVLLNVHFGRQDLDSTFQTYIAWGLLPEAYGNFGPKAGAVFLGVCLGLFFAWFEKFTARKLLLSLEGFIAFIILLGIAGSYEMVASILITSLFQAIVPLIAASTPFIERSAATRPPAA